MRPAECKRILGQLQSGTDEGGALQTIKSLGSTNREARWKGPFAWSLLVHACNAQVSESWGDAVWTACEIVNLQERSLTLKVFDFEKILCNLVNRFLEAKVFSWTCALASLLFERLRCSCLDRRTSLGKVCLGRDFLALSPRLLTASDGAVSLLFNCQTAWIRLQTMQSPPPGVLLVADALLEAGGIVSNLCCLKEAKYVDLFLYHWRQIMLTLIAKRHSSLPDFIAIEVEALRALRTDLPNDLQESVLMARWKHFCTYAAAGALEGISLLVADSTPLYSLKKADKYLTTIEHSGAEGLRCLFVDWRGCAVDQWIIFFLAASRDIHLDGSSLRSLPSRISCSSAFELWLSHAAGRLLTKASAGILSQLLQLVNCLEIIRHESTMKALDGILKNLVISAAIKDECEFLTAARRFAKLALHFSKSIAGSASLCSMAKALAANGNIKMASCLLDICLAKFEVADKDALIAAVPELEPDQQSRAMDKLREGVKSSDRTALLAETWCGLIDRALHKHGSIDECLPLPDDESLLLKIIVLIPLRIAADQQVGLLTKISQMFPGSSVKCLCYFALLGCPQFSKVAALPNFKPQIRELGDEWALAGSLLALLWDYACKLDISASLEQVQHQIGRLADVRPPIPIPPDVLSASVSLLRLQRQYETALDLLSIAGSNEHGQLKLSLLLKLRRFEEASRLTTGSQDERLDVVKISIEMGDFACDWEERCERLEPIYQSKASFLVGSLAEAYMVAKKHFEDTLGSIRASRMMAELWTVHAELLETSDWLLYLTNVLSDYRLVRYYLKAGNAYVDSIRSPLWRSTIDQWSQLASMRAEGKGYCRTYSMPPGAKVPNSPRSITDIVDWIEYQLENDNSTAELADDLSIFMSDDSPRPVPQSHQSLYERARRYGTVDQVRRAACREILRTGDVNLMLDLINAVYERELMNPCRNLGRSKRINGYDYMMFLDRERSLLYFYCRRASFSKAPLIVRIRLQAAFDESLADLDRLLDENAKMLFRSDSTASGDEAKRTWWTARHALEKRLFRITDPMDRWLQPILPFLPANRHVGDAAKSQARLRSVAVPHEIDLVKLLSALTQAPSPDVAESVLRALGFAADDIVLVMSCVPQRLRPSANAPFEDDDPFQAVSPHSLARGSLLWFIDPLLHSFPWEACASLGRYTLIRTFGVGEKHSGLSITSISSLLNPSGDLKRTEEFLTPLLQSLAPSLSITGRAPSAGEMRRILGADLFLYFGHGSGELYLPASEISNLPSCGASMLFGCSSGRLKRCGSFRSEGALLAFREAASPLSVSNLWDVTDRDIDKLTDAFIRNLLLQDRPALLPVEGVSFALEEARPVCLLRLLNGAAPIVFLN